MRVTTVLEEVSAREVSGSYYDSEHQRKRL